MCASESAPGLILGPEVGAGSGAGLLGEDGVVGTGTSVGDGGRVEGSAGSCSRLIRGCTSTEELCSARTVSWNDWELGATQTTKAVAAAATPPSANRALGTVPNSVITSGWRTAGMAAVLSVVVCRSGSVTGPAMSSVIDDSSIIAAVLNVLSGVVVMVSNFLWPVSYIYKASYNIV
jgi:hypothetical protein